MISIGLNLILGVLLFCALVLGLRLERKLRGLRQSHLDFAKAVNELDQAAARTEHSLAALRAGTEAAKTDIASRIDQARIACQRLEALCADADKALAKGTAAAAERPLALSQPIERTAAEPVPLRPATEPVRPEAAHQGVPRLDAARSRAKLIDDDLFDSAPRASAEGSDPLASGRYAHERRAMLAAVMGGRR
jgi:hypothetical protein